MRKNSSLKKERKEKDEGTFDTSRHSIKTLMVNTMKENGDLEACSSYTFL